VGLGALKDLRGESLRGARVPCLGQILPITVSLGVIGKSGGRGQVGWFGHVSCEGAGGREVGGSAAVG